MKRISLYLCVLVAFVFLLAGCNGSSSSAVPSSPAPPSTAVASSTPPLSTPAAATKDLQQVLATLSEAANLGGTIPMTELDLTASGLIGKENIAAWAGAESQLASENGGIVIVIQAKPGTAESFVPQFEQFRDAKASDDRYAEYATAIANTKEARIVTKGDFVVYAVSATGHEGGYAALDAAIDAAFA